MKCSLFLFATVLLAAGCKQGLGDRCETDADCTSGLICSMGGTFHICEDPALVIADGGFNLGDARRIPDANFVPDAGAIPVPDAPSLPDAPFAIDAPLSVEPDAPILPDAPDSIDAPVGKR